MQEAADMEKQEREREAVLLGFFTACVYVGAAFSLIYAVGCGSSFHALPRSE